MNDDETFMMLSSRLEPVNRDLSEEESK